MPWWILDNSIIAAFLALIVALVCRVRRVPPVVRHALWLVVLIKLIAPPLFSGSIQIPIRWQSLTERLAARDGERADRRSGVLPLQISPADEIGNAMPRDARDAAGCRVYDDGAIQSIEELLEAAAALPETGNAGAADRYSIDGPPRADSLANDAEPFNSRPDDQVSAVDAPVIPDASHSPAEPSPPPASLSTTLSRPISAATFLMAGFITATCIVIGVQAVRLMKLRRLLRRAVPAPCDFLSIVEDVATTIGVRAPQVRFTADISSPFVCTFGRPILLWPASRLASLGDNALRAVILHELAHLARRDHLVGWLELGAACLWWWNPLFWYVRHQLRETAELACDAWVMALIPEGRRDYARALVDLAELDSHGRRAALALGVAEGSRNLFERRLVMIMGTRVRHRMGVFGILGTGLMALAALPGCTAGQASEELVAVTEEASATMDTEEGDDPFRPISEPPAVSARPRIAAVQNPLDTAELPSRPGADEPSDPDVRDPAPEPLVASPAGPQVRIGSLAPLKTLTLTVTSGKLGEVTSIAAGTDILADGPIEFAQGDLARGLRRLFDAESEPFEQVLLNVDKNVNYNDLKRIKGICAAQKSRHVLKVALVETDASDTGPAAPATASNEDRLKRLEDRFDALLKELRDARNPAHRKSAPPAVDGYAPQNTTQKSAKTLPSMPVKSVPPASEYSLRSITRGSQRDGDVETVALTRATYKFPADKARALKAFTEFLAMNLSDEVEVRFKDSALQVTASAEDQAVIAQFIRLLQAHGSAGPRPPSKRIDEGADDAFDGRKGPAQSETETKPGPRVGF